MMNKELAFSSAWELRGLIAARQVSPLELTELFLRRIEELNPKLNAYLTVTAEEAMASARVAEQAVAKGDPLGPLHGIPVSLKDLDLTKGIRTTLGSLLFKDTVPDQDSISVERTRQSGAIILGKTNTPEFGLSGTTENRLGDACRNPWNTERTAGGSSGGAGAAIAASLCVMGSGSDAGGSIRIPSSFCGIYGIKPTLGRVPRFGGLGQPAPNQFSQAGPMSRTVRDSALLLQVMAGPDPRDPDCIREKPADYLAALDQGVRGLRMAWSLDLGYAAVDPQVAEATSKAAQVFEELGCSLEEAGLALEDLKDHWVTMYSANSYISYGHLFEQDPGSLTDYARKTYEDAKTLTAADYARALVGIGRVQAQLNQLLERYDILLTPTMPVPAFPIGQRPQTIGGKSVDPWWGFTPFMSPINIAGLPAASVPCGFSAEGMPLGLHIVGRRGDEATVLRASAAFEEARPWIDKRPPVS